MKVEGLRVRKILLKLDSYYAHKKLRPLFEAYKAMRKLDTSVGDFKHEGIVFEVREAEVRLKELFEESPGTKVTFDLKDSILHIEGDSPLATAVREIACRHLLEKVDVEFYVLEDEDLFRLDHRPDLGGFMKMSLDVNGNDVEGVEFLSYRKIWALYAGERVQKFEDKVVMPRRVTDEKEKVS